MAFFFLSNFTCKTCSPGEASITTDDVYYVSQSHKVKWRGFREKIMHVHLLFGNILYAQVYTRPNGTYIISGHGRLNLIL